MSTCPRLSRRRQTLADKKTPHAAADPQAPAETRKRASDRQQKDARKATLLARLADLVTSLGDTE